MSAGPLFDCNRFVRQVSGVWTTVSAATSDGVTCTYSDGDASENAVREAVERLRDPSTDSRELDRDWDNWGLEYHLSPKRANIIRALNLSGVHRVLEVGCGCGAITRYLGEQGLQVDAIEGSPRRAEIARARCRDLSNVNVMNANYYSLELPTSAYDLVLYIGVMEYASTYSPQPRTPREDVIAMLRTARDCLASTGVVVVAIENRLGFKYLFGATEDHYHLPYVGVYGYPNTDIERHRRKRDIRTYDLREWRTIIDDAGDLHAEFYFPFPDYKLPELLLGEAYVTNNPYCYAHLARVASRDYVRPWTPPLNEYLYWNAAAQTGTLSTTSNSFGMVIGRDARAVGGVLQFDFVHYHNPNRRHAFRTLTEKQRGGDTVCKRLVHALPDQDSGLVRHALEAVRYVPGHLLEDVWQRALASNGGTPVLKSLTLKYLDYLRGLAKDPASAPVLIDAVPRNVVVDRDGHCQLIDREWHIRSGVPPEYVLFRALMYFAYVQRSAVHELAVAHGLRKVADFVALGFSLAGLDLAAPLNDYVELEDRFQQTILLELARRPVAELLDTALLGQALRAPPSSVVQVYWADQDDAYSEERSVQVTWALSATPQRLRIPLPASVTDAAWLRIDPADHRLAPVDALINIRRLAVLASEDDGETTLASWTGDQIATGCRVHGLIPIEAGGQLIFTISSADPQIHIPLPAPETRGDAALSVEFEASWPVTEQCLQIRRVFERVDSILAEQIRQRQAELAALDQRLAGHRGESITTRHRGALLRLLKGKTKRT